MVRLMRGGTVVALLCTLWVSLSAQQQASPAPVDIRSSLYRGRPVTYQVIDGVAIYEGDIVLGSAQELEAAPKPGRNEAIVISPLLMRWPGGVVPYVVDAGLAASQQGWVRAAVDHWNSNTPIRFVERTNESNFVWFLPDSSGGCSSVVGMANIGGQKISLGGTCTTPTIIHEMGHAVGLWHEQSRSDRDRYVAVWQQNIDKRSADNFDQELTYGMDSGSYDFGSIMHYGPFDFSRNGEVTIETIPPGIRIGRATGLSAGDIDGVRRLYEQPSTATVIATDPTGLEIVVDGAKYTAPASFQWAPASAHTVSVTSPQGNTAERFLFGRWSDDGQQTHTVTASPQLTVFTAGFVVQYPVILGVNPAASGSVEISTAAQDSLYANRTSLQIRAIPAPGYSFLNWTGGWVSGSANPKQIRAGEADSVTAEFTKSVVTTVSSEPPGRTVLVDGLPYTAPQGFAWTAGSAHTLLVSPTTQTSGPARFVFNSWSGGGTGGLTVTAKSEPATYTARFTPQYPLTLIGSVSANPASSDGYYDSGTSVELTANAPPGQRLDYWSGDLGGNQNPVSLVVDDQKEVTANFAPISTAALTAVNAGSYTSGAVAPGEILALLGSNLGPDTPAPLQLDGSGMVATELAGVKISFDGVAAPMVLAYKTESMVVVPFSAAGKSTTRLQVDYAGRSQILNLQVTDAAPGIFALDTDGRGQGAILNEDGFTVNSPSQPAPKGSIITFYASGAGQTDPPGQTGAVLVSVLPKPLLPVSVKIGGVSAEVQYAGAAPHCVSGVIQVNVRVPPNVAPGDYVPVVLTVGSQSSLPAITVAVR